MDVAAAVREILLFLPSLIPEGFRPWLMAVGVISLIISLILGRVIAAAASAFFIYLGAGDVLS